MNKQKKAITFPSLNDEDRGKSFEMTKKFSYWATNESRSIKVPLSQIISQAQYFGDSQKSRVKGIDKAVVDQICRSYYVGIQVNELPVIVKDPNSNKYILIEGNNRYAAALKFCEENSLDESKAHFDALYQQSKPNQ